MSNETQKELADGDVCEVEDPKLMTLNKIGWITMMELWTLKAPSKGGLERMR